VKSRFPMSNQDWCSGCASLAGHQENTWSTRVNSDSSSILSQFGPDIRRSRRREVSHRLKVQ
jgi:hypothetical protein